MSSLDFLYIALGGGFVLIAIFLCVLLLHLTLVLRDVNKISENAREVSEKVKTVILEPLKILAEAGASLGVIKAFINKLKDKYSVSEEEIEEMEEEMQEESKK